MPPEELWGICKPLYECEISKAREAGVREHKKCSLFPQAEETEAWKHSAYLLFRDKDEAKFRSPDAQSIQFTFHHIILYTYGKMKINTLHSTISPGTLM